MEIKLPSFTERGVEQQKLTLHARRSHSGTALLSTHDMTYAQATNKSSR